MPRLAALLLLAAAACRGEGTDPKCSQARSLYVAHQRAAVERALPTVPDARRASLEKQAEEEIRKSEALFLAACEEMDAARLLACLRSPQSMDDPGCAPVADELRRRMAP